MSQLLEGKVALVTGGGRGVGRASRSRSPRPARKSSSTTSAPRSTGQASGNSPRRKWWPTSRRRAARRSSTAARSPTGTRRMRMVACGGRPLRPNRHRRQQRRHPARRDIPPDDRARVRRGGRGAPEGHASTSAAPPRRIFKEQGAGVYVHMTLDVGADRQFRAGQLRGREARHRGAVEGDRDRHGRNSACGRMRSRRSRGRA